MDDPLVGATLARYTIVERLGAGGMGVVYRAWDPTLDRHVALKVLGREEATEARRLERFRREARTIAALNHPNIIAVYSVESADGLEFITMELVDGTTLDSALPDSGLDVLRFLAYALPVADAVAAAHGHGITHRDIKPQNLMVSESGQVKVLDFGLAERVIQPAATESVAAATDEDVARLGISPQATVVAGRILGTGAYLAPELWEGQPATAASDVFALGVTFYHLLTGTAPFQGRNAMELLAAILTRSPTPVGDLRKDAPARLIRMIDACLSKDPAERPTAVEVHDTLADLDIELRARPLLGQWRRRALLVATPLALALVATLSNVLSNRNAPGAGRPLLAVLPFEDLSAAESAISLAEGLHLEVTSRLTSRLPDVVIRPRESTLRFSGSEVDFARVAEELAVDYVLAAAVQQVDDRVRLVSRLIDARRDAQMWSVIIEGSSSAEGLFQLQDSIARLVADALEVELELEGGDRPTRDDVAYRLYLDGSVMATSPSMRGNQTAEVLLKQAIGFDPEFAQAYAKLGRVYGARAQFLGGGRHWADSAMVAAERAIELDSTEAEAWVALGSARQNQGRFSAALDAFRRAATMAPNLAAPLSEGSFLAFLLGRIDEAAAQQIALFEIDPDQHFVVGTVGSMLGMMGDYGAAERWIQAAASKVPDQPAIRSYRIQLLTAQERWDEARTAADEWLETQSGNPFALAVAAYAAMNQGDVARTQRLAGAADVLAPGLRGVVGFTLRSALGHALLRTGDPTEARRLLGETIAEGEALIAEGDDRPGVRFDIAACHASLGEVDRALEWLDSAYDAGWRHNEWVPQGLAAFEGMRDDPRFQAWVDKVEADVRARSTLISFESVRPTALRDFQGG